MGKYFSKEKWKYMFYTITHPMDGYYWIRHQDVSNQINNRRKRWQRRRKRLQK